MSETRTYTPLAEIPKALIGKCSAVLANHMQCWRAGDFQVSVVTTIPSEVEGEEPVVKLVTYQLCRAHAIVEQKAYEKAVADEAALATAQMAVQQDSKVKN